MAKSGYTQMKRFEQAKKRFPVFGAIVLVTGVVWLLNALSVFSIELPWLPILVIVLGVGMLTNHYQHSEDE
jgi:hypothetical protein